MIWCVEDDGSIRDIEVYALQSAGLAARGFGDGSSFWEAVQKERPDLVVLDIMLPGVDGVELRFPVTFAVSVAETPRYPCLQSLEAEECGKKDENVPSLVLRAMKQGERLWDIAKLYRTTVEAILAANELKEESAAVIGKLLLIPRRR